MCQTQKMAPWPHLIEDKQDYIRVSFPADTLIDIDQLMGMLGLEIERIEQLGKNDLWDLQDCSIDRNLNFLTLREAVLFIIGRGFRRGTSGKTAILVNSDCVYGVARTFQSIAEVKNIGYEIEIFHDESLALAWMKTPVRQHISEV